MKFTYENAAEAKSETVTFVRWLPGQKSGPNMHAMVKFADGQVREVPARLLFPIVPKAAVR